MHSQMLKPKSFHIRIDSDDHIGIVSFANKLFANSHSVFAVHEISTEVGKNHYHMLVEGYLFGITTLRKYIKEHLTGITGSQYSICELKQFHYEKKEKTVEGGYQYLCKGKGRIPQPESLDDISIIDDYVNVTYNYEKGQIFCNGNPDQLKLSIQSILDYNHKYWDIHKKEQSSKREKGPISEAIWNKLVKLKYFDDKKWSNYNIKHFILHDHYQRHCSLPAINNIDAIMRYLYLRYRIEYEGETEAQAIDYLLQCIYGLSSFSEEGIRDHNCCQCDQDR